MDVAHMMVGVGLDRRTACGLYPNQTHKKAWRLKDVTCPACVASAAYVAHKRDNEALLGKDKP